MRCMLTENVPRLIHGPRALAIQIILMTGDSTQCWGLATPRNMQLIIIMVRLDRRTVIIMEKPVLYIRSCLGTSMCVYW